MREIKNLKGYRQKPTIYGLNTFAFLFNVIVVIIGLLSFLAGISFFKVVLVAVIIGITYLISLALSSNTTIQEWLFDEKLPEKFSDDE